MRQIPAIVDGELKLFESHAVLIYIACAFPRVASHWYPDDIYKRAKIHSVLDWHHSFLRRGAAGLVFNTLLAPLNGIRSYPQLLSEKDRDRILSPYVKVVKWVEDTKSAISPHFEEVHGVLFESQKRIREQMATKSRKNQARSKM
ncbi:hypothetical protein SSX86_001330 [Deinandra increscens subsp. villosa]|uniref:GST N-terminal domain-containing protein n=1 Tax=Deinandra increscens subsp. villosa TaxID=3103831 RepID=A0AAP0DV47_9ASTR